MLKLQLNMPLTVIPKVTDGVIIVPGTGLDPAIFTKAINAGTGVYIAKSTITSIKSIITKTDGIIPNTRNTSNRTPNGPTIKVAEEHTMFVVTPPQFAVGHKRIGRGRPRFVAGMAAFSGSS